MVNTPKIPCSTGPPWQNSKNEWWQLLSFFLSVPSNQSLLKKNCSLSRLVPRKIPGHQSHLGPQHCPAILPCSLGYLILLSPTIIFSEFLYFSQTSNFPTVHPFSVDGLASCFVEKITITWGLPQFSSIRSEKIRLYLRPCPLSSYYYNAGSVLSKVSPSTWPLDPTPFPLSLTCKFNSKLSIFLKSS